MTQKTHHAGLRLTSSQRDWVIIGIPRLFSCERRRWLFESPHFGPQKAAYVFTLAITPPTCSGVGASARTTTCGDSEPIRRAEVTAVKIKKTLKFNGTFSSLLIFHPGAQSRCSAHRVCDSCVLLLLYFLPPTRVRPDCWLRSASYTSHQQGNNNANARAHTHQSTNQ